MEWPTHPSLFILSLVPSILMLAVATAIVLWRRSVGAIAALLFSLGVAFLVLVLLVMVSFTFNARYPVRQSLVALLGVPLLAYAIAMITLTDRARIALFRAIPCAVIGLAGLYFMGGFVLMYSVCSYGTGGC